MKEKIRMMVYMAFVLAVVGIWGSASVTASNTGHLTDYPVVENGQEVINLELNELIGKVVLVISAPKLDSPDRWYCIGTLISINDDGKWLILQYNGAPWVQKLVKAYRKKIDAENKERRRSWKALKDKEGKERRHDFFTCKNKASFSMKDFTTAVDIPEDLYEIYMLSSSEPMKLVYRGQPKNLYDRAHIEKKRREKEAILQSIVTYEVTGTADSVNVTYSVHGSTNQENGVKLPWRHIFPANDWEFLYISAQNQGRTGKIEVTISKGDNVFKSAYGEGAFAIATCSGGF